MLLCKSSLWVLKYEQRGHKVGLYTVCGLLRSFSWFLHTDIDYIASLPGHPQIDLTEKLGMAWEVGVDWSFSAKLKLFISQLWPNWALSGACSVQNVYLQNCKHKLVLPVVWGQMFPHHTNTTGMVWWEGLRFEWFSGWEWRKVPGSIPVEFFLLIYFSTSCLSLLQALSVLFVNFTSSQLYV